MRLSSIYLKHNPRAAQNVDRVPFREVMPLKLRNKVSGGRMHTLEDKCLYEMILLFGCWKKTNFEDGKCNKEMEIMNGCYNKYLKNSALQKQLEKVEVPTPNAKSLTDKQVTYLLRIYPTV